MRVLAILDSQAAISVLAKGRSSSQMLNKLLRRVAGLTIACELRLAYAWCASALNPADEPSRAHD